MRRINIVITLVLAVAAVLLWADVWYMSRHSWGNMWHFSGFVYPTIIATVFTGCSCLTWVLAVYAHGRGDDETRCRKCKYILKGLSEPRCPECGEPI